MPPAPLAARRAAVRRLAALRPVVHSVLSREALLDDAADDVEWQATIPADFSVGLQLLPRTALRYRWAWAEALLSLDALSFGLAARALGVVAAREERLVLVAVPASGGVAAHTLFQPILTPTPATQFAFDGRRYATALASRRIFLVLLILLGINIGAWVISFTTLAVGADRNPLQPVWAWQFAFLRDFSAAVLGTAPPMLALAGWASLVAVLGALFHTLAVVGKNAIATHTDVNPGDLTSVLPLVLTPRAPLVMVSYPWLDHHAAVARSLAAALPNAWVDVQMLAPGVVVADTTRAVSRWANTLVLVVSDAYLERPACCLELVTAMLRRQPYQRTVAYAPDGAVSSPEVLDILRAAGVDVVASAAALLRFLNDEVYCAVSPEALARTIEWYARTSTPRADVPRTLSLPSPFVASGQPLLAGPCSGRLCAPRRAIRAGARFLSADGLQLGWSLALSLEHVALAVVVAGAALAAGFFAGAHARGPLSLGTIVGVPLVSLAVVALLVASALPLSVDLDVRRSHSGLLLPLNVAAFCNALGAARSRHGPLAHAPLEYSVAFLVAPPPGGGGGGGGGDDVAARIGNIAAFLNEMGVRATVEPFCPADAASDGTRAARLFVFVL